MPDILIRDVPDTVLAGLDAQAGRLRLSRSEYIRRTLSQEAARGTRECTVEDLRRFSTLAADLADPEIMDQAWK